MKKKKILPVIILIAVLIVLVVIYSFLKNNNDEKNKTTEETSLKVTDIDSSSIRELTIKNSKGEMKFSYDEASDKWKDVNDDTFKVDESKINSILSNACGLDVTRELDDNLDNISEYGLDSPAIVLTMTDKDGKDTKINIGNCNSNSGNYYMYIEGNEKVYMIGSSFETSLDISVSDMQETTTEAQTTTGAEATTEVQTTKEQTTE